MFRKLVSNLAFSPALIGQLGFYAKRLRREELTRRFGLIFTVLALVVQSFAVFQPPEAANASSNADFVRGGVSSVGGFLNAYDNNSRNIKDLFTSLGITRAEIKAAKSGTVTEKGYYNWSMTSLYSHAQGQRAYKFYNARGGSDTVYNRPMSLTQTGRSPYPVFVGHSAKFGFFAIKKDCGNLVTKKRPPADKPPHSSCEKLQATLVSRTQVRFTARGDVTNGAKISGYTFTVKNDEGKTIHTKKVSTSSESAQYTYERTKPGNYKASVVVHTSLGNKGDSNCRASFTVKPPVTPPTQPPAPLAECSSLSTSLVGHTNVELTGAATVANGATVSKYTFVIKDSSGKEISRQVVTTAELKAVADTIVVDTPGAYTATLIVTTSLGDKADATDCVDKFTISPPNVCAVKPELPANSPDCQPCPGDSTIWIKDAECAGELIEQKTAINIDQAEAMAATVTARASDRISYTVSVQNTGTLAVTTPIEEQLEDVLQYATLADAGGGTFNEQTKVLSWPAVEIKPGEKQSRTFMVRLASAIPSTNTGTSDAASYDCTMTHTFGHSIDIMVECPVEKVVVEQVVSELPKTGPRENLIFAGVLLSVVTYFYLRARQTGKEVRLIRRDINAGTI